MKKFLLLLLMLVCVIGPRAHATPTVSTSTKTLSNETKLTVAEIYLENAGELSTALQDAALSGGFDYLHLSTDNDVDLDANDITALESVNVKTIEMQHVYGTQAFIFANSNVEYFILPYGWTKDEVNSFAQANITSSNFKACLSTSDTENEGDATLVAYLRHSNTLADAISQMYYDTKDYKTLGNGNGNCSRLKKLVVMGHFCARDISRAGNYDTDGHYVINGTADENSQGYNKNTDGGDLYTTAENPGALNGCYQLQVLDLSGGLISDTYATDLVIAYNGIPATELRELWIPEDPSLRTIPADFLNTSSNYLHQICLPSNIEIIRTRAFAGSGCRINYVWTKDITGTVTDTRFDNGAYFVSGSDVTQKYMAPNVADDMAFEENDKNSFTYGTITLPPNLQLIERFAFASNKVKDVYCLNTTAPECHVDAFNTVMYLANNTLDRSLIVDGVVKREAYSMSNYEMATMLHYPRETTTPDIQRYMDPTREYSIATGHRDGYGNMIYFPNQSEMVYSYLQASSGYVWKAWDDSRNWYNHELSSGYGSGLPLDQSSHITNNGNRIQEYGNGRWISNEYEGKYDRSFYDVTTGDNNQIGEVDAPTGLEPYYNTVWQGSTLYPQLGLSQEVFYKYVEATEEDFENGITVYTLSGDDYTESNTWTEGTTYYKRLQNQVKDANDNLSYTSCEKGHFVKDYRYEPDDDGDYVEIATPNGAKAVNSPVEGVTYYSDNSLTDEATPKVGNGFYYEDGTNPVFSDASNKADRSVDTYYNSTNINDPATPVLNQTYYYNTGNQVPVISSAIKKPVDGIDIYYTDMAGTNQQTPSFNNWATYYYTTGQQVEVPVYTSVNYGQLVPNKTYYTKNGNDYTEVLPDFNGTYYYYDQDTESYVQTSKLISGVWTYYNYGWHNNAEGYYEDTPYLAGLYYYISSYTQEQEYIQTSQFVSGYYTYYKFDNNQYVEYSGDLFNQDYYYATGETTDEYLPTTEWVPTRTYYTANSQNNVIVSYSEVTGDLYFTENLYHIVGYTPNYSSAGGEDYDPSLTYYTDAEGTTEAETVTFDTDYYIQDYTYSYVEYTGSEEGTRCDKVQYYREATAEELADTEITHYCPEMEDIAFHNITNYKDYRGWHQFVLTGYGYNGTTPMEPLKFFINDNDWWTICEPYDLRYSEMIRFFGTQGENPKLPYLSKLMYVVRDVENQRITLMFSKNLMEYKEQFLEANGNIADRVHGVVDDETQWTAQELNDDPVIMHAGVPYLIRPNLTQQTDEDTGESYYVRQFDTYKSENEVLYNRLKAAQDMGGAKMDTLIYHGEYTVPAYVVGYESPDASPESLDEDGELTITMLDGTSITYQDSYKDETKTISYGGKDDVKYRISEVFKYTFVGSFFLSVMPQYSYFLGWVGDKDSGHAAFWYSGKQDFSGWKWNNETGIIMPNFDTSTLIHSATGVDDPARWTIVSAAGVSSLKADDFAVSQSSSQSAKSYTMEIGGTNFFDGQGSDNIDSVEELPLQTKTELSTAIYTLSGSYVGTSERGLAKGVYIRNGKKLVIK